LQQNSRFCVLGGWAHSSEDALHARAIQLDHVDLRPARTGDRPTAAQASTLFEAFEARLRAYVAFRIREPADVDDLIGDVFRRVVSGPIPADEGAWPAWIFRVAHNAVVDHYRRRRPFFGPLAFGLDRPDDAPGLPERAIRGEQLRATDVALRRLPGRQRAAIYLRYYEGLDFAEIATILGVPSSTARTLVHRGLKRVAAELQSDEGH
jgi:RNA polymerase sigma-70 factor, ECF subfamily